MKHTIALAACALLLLIWSDAMCSTKYQEVPESALKGQVRTNLDNPDPTKAQLDRKEKFTQAVSALGVPVLSSAVFQS